MGTCRGQPTLMKLAAKKSGKAKGFGKKSSSSSFSNIPKKTSENNVDNTGFPLESIESTEASPMTTKLNKAVDLDPNASAEERADKILRERFNMMSYEERQGDITAEAKRREAKERAEKLKKLAAIDDGSFDIFSVLPVGLVKFIDGFLKIGLGICVVLFILAGVGITFEAYASATGNPLPPDIDEIIVNVIEPSFTPGLLVLLGFSVSLGLFASAQLGSASSQYQEKP